MKVGNNKTSKTKQWYINSGHHWKMAQKTQLLDYLLCLCFWTKPDAIKAFKRSCVWMWRRDFNVWCRFEFKPCDCHQFVVAESTQIRHRLVMIIMHRVYKDIISYLFSSYPFNSFSILTCYFFLTDRSIAMNGKTKSVLQSLMIITDGKLSFIAIFYSPADHHYGYTVKKDIYQFIYVRNERENYFPFWMIEHIQHVTITSQPKCGIRFVPILFCSFA